MVAAEMQQETKVADKTTKTVRTTRLPVRVTVVVDQPEQPKPTAEAERRAKRGEADRKAAEDKKAKEAAEARKAEEAKKAEAKRGGKKNEPKKRDWMLDVLFVLTGLLFLAIVIIGFLAVRGNTPAPAPIANATSTPFVVIQPTRTPFQPAAATPTPVIVPPTVIVAPVTGPASNWTIQYFDGATDQMHEWGDNLKTLVWDWTAFPNVDFAKYGFKTKDGLEYGMAESAYCQQDTRCDVNTAAMHYRLISGDYTIPNVDSCKATDGQGCAIAIFNVGNVTAMWRDSNVDYGFTVTGRYWNGDAMATTVWALGSNTVYNMTVADSVNPGANCSVPDGCESVRFMWVVTSGNQVLLKAVTVVVSP